MSYITLKDRWCDDIALNEYKSNIQRLTFMRNWNVYSIIPEVPYEFFLRDFITKLGREGIFKPTTGNESLHEIRNDNGVRVINVDTSKNLSTV